MVTKHARQGTPSADPIVRAYTDFLELKNLIRTGWTRTDLGRDVPPENAESVAEHSFGVAVLGYMIASEIRPDLDAYKVMALGMFHETGEIYGKDPTIFDGIPEEEKASAEEASARRVFSPLSDPEKYVSLWKEYDKGESPEAKFVRQIDRLEMIFQAKGYQELGYSVPNFMADIGKRITDPALKEILSEIGYSG